MSKKWFDLEEEARLAKKKRISESQNTQAEERNIREIVCPECGTKLYHEAGCIRCYSCGWSKC